MSPMLPTASDSAWASCGGTFRHFLRRAARLVLCLLNGWCFAARIFRSRRGASDEHIPQWICKERATKPGAKRTAALWVAPSHLGDTTLDNPRDPALVP